MTGPTSADLASAYDRTAAAWEQGPARLVYDRLAAALVAASPVPLAGRLVLDVGAGTGAASRAIAAAGGIPVAVDISAAMLRANPAGATRALVSDARDLAVATAGAGGLVAAFSFNHLPDPVAGFREAARVCRPGSPVLVAAYASDDDHPAKAAVDQALASAGWSPETWYPTLRTQAMPVLATEPGMQSAAHTAGMEGQTHRVTIAFPDLTPEDLIGWRLGLAHTAPFVAHCSPPTRYEIRLQALRLLGNNPPPLHRSLITFTALT